MTQEEEEKNTVPDENAKVVQPVDIIEQGKVEDGKRKFMVPLRPHEMIWNFFYDDEKTKPEHVMRADSAPHKCYIDGRCEKLMEHIETLSELLKTFTPERWEKLNYHTLEIFKSLEKDSEAAYQSWLATQQN